MLFDKRMPEFELQRFIVWSRYTDRELNSMYPCILYFAPHCEMIMKEFVVKFSGY